MNDRDLNIPTSKPCPSLPGCVCPQGMVLEIDPHEEGTVPTARYRCQDCDRREELCIEIEETRYCPRRTDGKGIWDWNKGRPLSRVMRVVRQDPDDEELLS